MEPVRAGGLVRERDRRDLEFWQGLTSRTMKPWRRSPVRNAKGAGGATAEAVERALRRMLKTTPRIAESRRRLGGGGGGVGGGRSLNLALELARRSQRRSFTLARPIRVE